MKHYDEYDEVERVTCDGCSKAENEKDALFITVTGAKGVSFGEARDYCGTCYMATFTREAVAR